MPLPAAPAVEPPIDALRRADALAFLYARIDYERARNVPYRLREFKLDRMRELLARLDNPHERLPIVHVAGTKGKGSTATMMGAILSASGYRTGVFTSPHLDRLEERMRVDDRNCTPAETVALLEQVRAAVEEMDRQAARSNPPEPGPTYFEITTAMALLHFVQHKVDLAVMEVGLGGRLDSTNVCRPQVSIITSISYDHTRQLGRTLEAIAGEKAGIVKPGVALVSGVTEPGPRQVIREVCRARGSRLLELGIDFAVEYDPPRGLETADALGRMSFEHRAADGPWACRDLLLSLVGRHQAANAGVALAAIGELRRRGWVIPEDACRRALAGIAWPARCELVARHPAIVVDAAHNVASIEALVRVLDESFSVRRRLLAFATTQEKDVRGMLALLLDKFDTVVFTRYQNNPRGVPPGRLRRVAAGLTGRQYTVCVGPAEAWDAVRSEAGAEDLICVTGSFFIAAEMRHEIAARPARAGPGPDRREIA